MLHNKLKQNLYTETEKKLKKFRHDFAIDE